MVAAAAAASGMSSARYIPPVNFGYVEEDLYRCGRPNELNFPFLEKLQLKKILYLAPDDPEQALYVRKESPLWCRWTAWLVDLRHAPAHPR